MFGVTAQVLNRFCQDLGVVFQHSKAFVAIGAQKPALLIGGVVVVQAQSLTLQSTFSHVAPKAGVVYLH